MVSIALLWPEDHLRAPKERDRGAAFLNADHCVPDLRRAAKVHGGGAAENRAVSRGAEEVRLQLEGGEAARALRQVRDAAVAAARVRERDHRRGVQEAVGRHHLAAHRQATEY